MKYNKLIEVLFSTKNLNKILTEFNKLSLNDKQIILTNDKIKQRLYNIADINLLVNLLIDLPLGIRINFLKEINKEKYLQDYERIIIEFLKLQNYDEFDYKQLILFENMKDKQFLSSMFRKISSNKLKLIISVNYNQFISDFAFVEYSKKNLELVLDSKLIDNVSDNILFNELKKRLSSNKATTLIEINEFLNMNSSKQDHILINGKLENLENELIQVYRERFMNESSENLNKKFYELTQNLTYVNLLALQTIIFSVDDEKASELIKIFFSNVCKIEDEIEEKYLNSMIYNFRKLNSKTRELYNVTKLKQFSIIHYLNTGLINEDIDKLFNKKITIVQYQRTNIKKINKILKILNCIRNNSNNKSKKINLTILSYKLYYVFGYENAIELLNGKFGNINLKLLVTMLDRCNIKNVEFQKINNSYEPIINQYFVQFLIGEKKDNNTTIKRILRGELDLLINEFSNLYNNFGRFQHIIGKKVHLNKLIPLLEENSLMLLPNEYKLTKDIIDNIIKSYGYSDGFNNDNISSVDSKECIIDACNFYHNYLEKRVVSTIPRVFGTTQNNYNYEVLKLDDPIIMTLGYQTGCCFRLNGVSKEFLKYCSESLYARVIVIRNETNEICSMIPIIRNGNVIAGNSIERNSKADISKTCEALKCAFDDILKISNQYEEKPVIACCVNDLHENVSKFSNKAVNSNIFPISNSSFYTNYNSLTYIISSLENKTENDFELYVPKAMYFDERPNILVYHWGMKDLEVKNEVKKRVNSITYQHDMSEEDLYFNSYIVCSEDWYLKVDYYGIKGYCLQKDIRALEEFNNVKIYLEAKFGGKRIYEVDIKESGLNNGFDHIKSKKLILEKHNNIVE